MIVMYLVNADKAITIGNSSIPSTTITVEGNIEEVMEIIKILNKEFKLS